MAMIILRIHMHVHNMNEVPGTVFKSEQLISEYVNKMSIYGFILFHSL